MQSVTAIILAGQRQGESDPVAVAAGVPCKALAQIAGVPMVERVLAALDGCNAIGTKLLVMQAVADLGTYAPQLAAQLAADTVTRIDPALSPAQSALAALDAAPPQAPVLVTTADHVLLTSALLLEFLHGCSATLLDGAVGMLPLDLLLQKYPQQKRTRMRFADGGYKGCNLFWFRTPAAARPVLEFWRQLEGDRKRPWRMARRLGLRLLLRYLLGRLTLAEAFAQISDLTRSKLRPVILQVPEAALDVDSLADWHFIDTIARQTG